MIKGSRDATAVYPPGHQAIFTTVRQAVLLMIPSFSEPERKPFKSTATKLRLILLRHCRTVGKGRAYRR